MYFSIIRIQNLPACPFSEIQVYGSFLLSFRIFSWALNFLHYLYVKGGLSSLIFANLTLTFLSVLFILGIQNSFLGSIARVHIVPINPVLAVIYLLWLCWKEIRSFLSLLLLYCLLLIFNYFLKLSFRVMKHMFTLIKNKIKKIISNSKSVTKSNSTQALSFLV